MVRITIDLPDRPVADEEEREIAPAPGEARQATEPTATPVSARLPVALLAALDESARITGLTRTAEIIWRLEHSMATVELTRHFVVTEKKRGHEPAVSAPGGPATSDNSVGSHT